MMKLPEYRQPGFDSIVELELYVADSVREDPRLVAQGNVVGAVYQGAIGPLRDDLEGSGCAYLGLWTDTSTFDPDKVWAEALESGETYSATVYLLFVLVKEPDNLTGAGETYWQCMGEIDGDKLIAALKGE